MTIKSVSFLALCAAAAAALILAACALRAQQQPLPDYKLLTFGMSGNTFVYSAQQQAAGTVTLAVTGIGDFQTSDTSSAAGCFALNYGSSTAQRVSDNLCAAKLRGSE